MKQKWLVLLLAVVAGCQVVPPGEPSEEAGFVAQPISVFMAQVQTLNNALANGLSVQSVESLNAATLIVEDFDGAPFVNITVTAPMPISELWAFAATLSGNEWDEEDSSSPWTITISGASTARYPETMDGVGLETLIDFRDTIAAMGGPAKVSRVVAAMSSVFLVQDTAGVYWDPNTKLPVDAEWLAFLKENYADMKAENNTPEARKLIEDMWEPYMEPDATGNALSVTSQSKLANADGTLNFERAAELLKEQQGLSPQVRHKNAVECVPVFLGQKCYDITHGHINSWDNAHSGAFRQDPYWFGWKTTKTFTMPKCGLPGRNLTGTDVPLGCAPSAFISLIWRLWADGETFYGKKYNGEPQGKYWPYRSTKRPVGDTHYNKVDSIALDMTIDSNWAGGRPAIASYMGSCYFVSGTMTMAQRFVDGGNAFLKDQGKQASSRGAGKRLRIKGNFSHLLGNTRSAKDKGDILHRELGLYNRPVIVEYWLDKQGLTKAGHFSPVTEYQVLTPRGILSSSPIVKVKTIDTNSKWYAITDNGQAEVGVFFVERY